MLKKRSKSSFLANESGMAVLELIPTLFVYMILINFSLGFFGVIHAGILHSIAARNYTFETMFHRPNLTYHTRANPSQNPNNHFAGRGQRTSGIVYDQASVSDLDWIATQRPIAFTTSFGGKDKDGVTLAGRDPASRQGMPSEKQKHNQDIRGMNEAIRNDKIDVRTVWLKTVYGICLDANCGDGN